MIAIPGVNGNPYFWLGTHIAASLLISSKPSRTLETSRCGSHSVNPRPIRSIAALLSGVWRGRVVLAGTSTRYIRALAVRRVIPTPSAHWEPSLDPVVIKMVNQPKIFSIWNLLTHSLKTKIGLYLTSPAPCQTVHR